MSLPGNIPYVWITSLKAKNASVSDGDGVVRLDRQYLFPLGDTLLTISSHTDETSNVYALMRGLDEPGDYNLAYKINQDIIMQGLLHTRGIISIKTIVMILISINLMSPVQAK